MNFVERMAMKVLERSMKANKNPGPSRAIIPAAELTPEAIERMQRELIYYQRLSAQREAELLELQKLESLGNIEEHHRETKVREYLQHIEQLNLRTPGGLRCQPMAEEGEDQELVNEAWLRFCGRRAGGSARW